VKVKGKSMIFFLLVLMIFPMVIPGLATVYDPTWNVDLRTKYDPGNDGVDPETSIKFEFNVGTISKG